MRTALLTLAGVALTLTATMAAPNPSAGSKIDAVRSSLQANRGEASTTTLSTGDDFRFMPKARRGAEGFGNRNLTDFGSKKSAGRQTVTTARMGEVSPTQLPTADISSYVDGPNGETYYYTMEYDKDLVEHEYYTETLIKGYTITLYDPTFQVVGCIQDSIQLADNELKVASAQVGSLLTKKFFNYDNNLEVMVAISCNTAAYVNTYKTVVYSVNAGTVTTEKLTTVDGYYVSGVDTATDQWAEHWYLTFLTEDDTETPMVGEVVNVMDYHFKTYKYAGYGGMGDPVLDVRIPQIAVPGENAVPFLSTAYEGVPYFAVNRMKYCWFENPFDYENENPTADNELIVDIYAPASAWSSTVEKYSTTTIKSNTTVDDRYFLYLGAFGYDADLSFGKYSDDGLPSLIISTEHYLTASDGYNYDFDVYTPAAKGEEAEGEWKLNLIKRTEGGTFLNDIDGEDPQVMFVMVQNDGYRFDFVDELTGELQHSIPYELEQGLYFTNSAERVAKGDGYYYAVAQTHGASDDEGNVFTHIAYVNTDATIDHVDKLNMGKNVDYASVYIARDAFNPYIFNLDDNLEYMVLVKRKDSPTAASNHEELLVLSNDPEKEPLMQLLPDESLGQLATILYSNLDGKKPSLVVLYNNNYRYTLTAYDLPFSRFENGDGSVENPYEINSLGGLLYIKNEPSAHYAIVDDIDASGQTVKQSSFDFTGSLDGRDHIVSNLKLQGESLFPYISCPEGKDDSGVVKNIKFVRPSMQAGDDAQGIVAGTLSRGKISNVHIYDGELTAQSTAGGIAGGIYQYSLIEGSSFNGKITSRGAAGGIAGGSRTSSSVKGCLFSGEIEGGSTVGGIIGSMIATADEVSNCHVNAKITANNTVGGIAGSTAHSSIKNCVVEGTIEAVSASQWGGGPKLGGIVGEMNRGGVGEPGGEGDESAETPAAAISGCFVNLSALTDSTTPVEEEYEGQNATFHRIAGWTAFNIDPSIEGVSRVEEGFADNYVNEAIAKVSADHEDAANSVEGKSIDPASVDKSFLEGIGYLFGSDVATPWKEEMNAGKAALWFEGGLLVATPAEITIAMEESAEITVELLGIYGDIDTQEIEFSIDNAEIATLGEYESDFGKSGSVSVTGREKGTATVTARLADGRTASCVVTVTPPASVGSIEKEELGIRVKGGEISAAGCRIEVYNLAGVAVAEGHESVRISAPGFYIVKATGASGKSSAAKIRI